MRRLLFLAAAAAVALGLVTAATGADSDVRKSVEPRTPAEWGAYAYFIGNSHQPVMITDTTIVCPDVPGMAQVLAYHAIPFRPADMRFTPIAMNAGHQHQPR